MNYKKILIIVAVYFVCVNTLMAQFSGFYEIEPIPDNCVAGKISQTGQDSVLQLINKIRSYHKLAPVKWTSAYDSLPQSAALSMARTDIMSHAPTPGQCTDVYSDSGRGQSNLMLGSGTGNYTINYDKAIIGWLMDVNSISNSHVVGHRRLIVNPFLQETALGLINTKHPTKQGWNINAAALWGITDDAMGPAGCENDFVAYPYENYPPEWVDKAFYLNFCPIPDANFWYSGGSAVNFKNAKITMQDEAGNNIVVSDIHYDTVAWGCFQHNISWKAADLKDGVRYDVHIENVLVYSTVRSYDYWFKLTNESPTPLATVPTLVAPANGAENISLPFDLVWGESENAELYKLEVSRNNTFTNKEVDVTIPETNYNYTNTLINNTTYYWRVAAINESGVISDYSDTWSFNSMAIISDPPVTIRPAANNQDIARRDEYKWESANEAVYYNLQIANAADFTTSSIVVDQKEIYDTTYYLTTDQSLDEFSNYWWRVNAYLLSDTVTEWSQSVPYKTNDVESSIAEFPDGIIVSSYPNPFSTSVTISINTYTPTDVNIEIFDLLGEKVTTLFNGIVSESKEIQWIPTLSNSAVYFCKVRIGDIFRIITLNKN